MYVIADLEWVMNASGQISPSQLAGIRVDEAWNVIDRFSALMRPKDCGFHDWEHIAYTGGSAWDFLRAKSAHSELERFRCWLAPKDVLLWWSEESDTVFRKLCSWMFKEKCPNRTQTIDRYIYAFLYGQKNAAGNVYRIAEARGIETRPDLQHCAENDAEVLRLLLQQLGYPSEKLMEPPDKPKKVLPPDPRTAELPYQIDPAAKRIHRRDCPTLLTGGIQTHGIERLKNQVGKDLKPCSCCRGDFRAALRQRNADLLERSQYNYAYAPDSAVFHRPSCGALLSARAILGAVKYETAVKTGRTPCKNCRPTDKDPKKPLSVLQPPPRALPKKIASIPDELGRAIRRQKKARAERERRLAEEDLSKQETEDIYTLTQPRFAFWAGKGYRRFHLRDCPELNRLTELRGFATFAEATRSGRVACRKCRPDPKHDMVVSVPITNRKRKNENLDEIEAMLGLLGFRHHREAELLCVETPAGKWRIDTEHLPVTLEHINLMRFPDAQSYHKQPRIFLSFTDAVDYIRRHDEELIKKTAERRPVAAAK